MRGMANLSNKLGMLLRRLHLKLLALMCKPWLDLHKFKRYAGVSTEKESLVVKSLNTIAPPPQAQASVKE